MADAPPFSDCAQELRRHDRGRYLAALFAPADRREDLFALYAFNLELAKTAELVSEALLGRIRLQWWRESLDGIYDGQPRRHAVITPLAAAVGRHGLSRVHFVQLIEGRAFDLEPEPPETLDHLTAYAAATSASLVLLALEVLGVRDGAAVEAGRAVGIAWALTGLLRAVPFHARQKRLYLPRDRVEAAGVDLGGLFELRASAELARVVGELAATAAEHLAAARRLRARVPRRALPALLPGRLASAYLGVLAQAGYDPFDPAVQVALPGEIWRLAWARLRGSY